MDPTACSIALLRSVTSQFIHQEHLLSRVGQTRPKVLLSVNAVRYNGKIHSHAQKLSQVIPGLTAQDVSPNLTVVLIPYVKESFVPQAGTEFPEHTKWEDFLGLSDKETSGVKEGEEKIDFYRASFDLPLWILFSSGTTGKVSISFN